jgi:hypothetical protein
VIGAGLEQQGPDAAVAQALVQVGVRGRDEPVTPRRHPGHGPLDLREHAIVELVVQDHEEFRAVAEVVEEGSLGHARLGDDLVDAHAGQSRAFRQRQAGGDQLIAGSRRAPLPDAGVHRTSTDCQGLKVAWKFGRPITGQHLRNLRVCSELPWRWGCSRN